MKELAHGHCQRTCNRQCSPSPPAPVTDPMGHTLCQSPPRPPTPRKALGVSGSHRSTGTFVRLFVNELMMHIVCFRRELDAMDPSICGFASAREGLSHSPLEVVSVLKLEQLGLAGHADPASLARTLVCFLPDPSPTAPSPPE